MVEELERGVIVTVALVRTILSYPRKGDRIGQHLYVHSTVPAALTAWFGDVY